MSDKFIESFSGRIPLSQASQDVASQVMLRALLHDIDGIVCKNALFRRRCRVTQTVKACISTNAAINKSLRRSQKGSNQDRRLPSRPIADYDGGRSSDSSYSQGRVRRPNHQQGLDVEDMDHYGKLSQRFKALKDARIPRPNRRGFSGHLKTLAQESISEGLSSEETIRKAQAQYDYSRKPGGNRATRRAAEFGHAVQPALESQSQSNAPERRTAGRRVFARNDQFRQPRAALNRNSALDENEGSHELSLPKDLQDDQDDRLLPRHRFTMGRRTPEGEKFSDTPTPSGSNGKVPSRGYNQTISASDDRAPLNMPYTTPASEFLYGTSVVTAALISPRRKLYKLYIYDGDNRESHDHDMKIRRMAVERGVTVERLKGDWLRVMDKMSGGRPHNGYVLEASPLPKLPVIGFRPVEGAQGPFHVILDHQSREDEQVNGKDTLIKYEVGFPRYPFVLLLDGILDPGNLGAILRSAFFLGVDAVAISNRSTAPVSPVALKASAGASESLPLISVNQPGTFLDSCRNNGWKIYAANAATGADPNQRSGNKTYVSASALGNPIQNHACILILGSEGEGLRWNIKKKADYDVCVEGPRMGQGRVDSLNVSVAAGLLCETFLRRPKRIGAPRDDLPDGSQARNHQEVTSGELLF